LYTVPTRSAVGRGQRFPLIPQAYCVSNCIAVSTLTLNPFRSPLILKLHYGASDRMRQLGISRIPFRTLRNKRNERKITVISHGFHRDSILLFNIHVPRVPTWRCLASERSPLTTLRLERGAASHIFSPKSAICNGASCSWFDLWEIRGCCYNWCPGTLRIHAYIVATP
jgi:hypothetical protein